MNFLTPNIHKMCDPILVTLLLNTTSWQSTQSQKCDPIQQHISISLLLGCNLPSPHKPITPLTNLCRGKTTSLINGLLTAKGLMDHSRHWLRPGFLIKCLFYPGRGFVNFYRENREFYCNTKKVKSVNLTQKEKADHYTFLGNCRPTAP